MVRLMRREVHKYQILWLILMDCAMGNIYGYARVSTNDQDLSLQLDDLKKAGCSKIFVSVKTSTRAIIFGQR